MATRAEVKTHFGVQLYKDNPQRLFQAGSAWDQQKLSFYYSTENGVDLAMKTILLRILKHEGNKNLPSNKWNETRAAINRDKVVNEAIDIITEISTYAKPGFNA